MKGEIPKHLTGREQEIVRLVAAGLISKDIADRLGISVLTVETHRANIHRKIGVHSVGQLVRYAFLEGLAEVTT